MTRYLVVCGNSVNHVDGFEEALRRVVECEGEAQLYRAELVMRLGRDEVGVLKRLLGVTAQAPPARAARGRCVYVVFDQMFKGFAEVIDRELRGECIELHEVMGRGIEKRVRVGDRLYREPARDDYDVLRLAEELARRGPVVLFTGDKRLADQARMIEGVHVEYMPPGEFGGKEMAIKHMIEVIRGLLKG